MAPRLDDHVRAKCFHPNGTFIEFSKDEIEQSIPQRFEKIARQFPDRTAVESIRHRLTYRELNQAANRTAHAVLSACAEDNRAVAVLMEHDTPVISAILGTLKAGKFYVPLDPSLPHARSKFIVDDAQAEVIITNKKHLSLAKSLVASARLLIDIDDMENFPDTVAKIWAEVLDLDQVGIDDNFFDLGGHSIAATRVISRVLNIFSMQLPIRALFDSPTVAEMAKVVIEHQDGS